MDETERLQEELDELRGRLKAFGDALPDLAFIIDREGRYIEILTGEESLLYAQATEIKGRLLHEVLPADKADLFLDLIRFTIASGKPQRLVYELDVLAGTRWFEAHTAPMAGGTALPSAVAISRDITDRVRAEQQQQRLVEKVIDAQEAERRRLAREIHDATAQSLAAIKLRLERLESHTRDTPNILRELAVVRDMSEAALTELLRLIQGLRPLILDDLGLASALKGLASGVKEVHGLPVKLDLRGVEDQPLPRSIETTVYRVAQEALTNATKHADASMAEISLAVTGEEICLRVRDDGKGFETAAPHQGFGVAGIRERAELHGGRCSVGAAPEGGTLVEFILPLRPDRESVDGL